MMPSRPSPLLRRLRTVVAALALGALLAPGGPATAADVEPTRAIDVAGRVEFRTRLASMLEAVQVHCVLPEADSTRLVHGAIRGMLDTLDPHTHFLDPEAYRTMREGQDGSFFGLGIIISVRRDRSGMNRLTVISPIDGMPAKRLGVRPGDIIAAIDGVRTNGLSLDGAVAKLRGDKGTSVTVTLERDGQTLDLEIERAEIPTESIQHAYMIRPDTGFVRVKDFTKVTTRELHEAVAELRDAGMKKLILDLRDNPGGLLDEAVTVSSTFLDAPQLVVETRGRVPGSNERHDAVKQTDQSAADLPLIVLVNRGSASASEIVAGAIQDHDRGLVVGGTTWGKGLVQSVYSLSGDCGLALTTARYYTPSGRQIQRDYRSSYFDYYYPQKDAGPRGEGHVTEGGRKVFSGGGIQPDVVVPELKPHPLVGRLIARSAFFRFAYNRHRLAHEGAVEIGYQLAPSDISEFQRFLADEQFAYTTEEWTEAESQVRVQLLGEIVNAHVGLDEGFKVLNEADPQVQAALGLWGHAERSVILQDARNGTTPVLGPAAPPSASGRLAEIDGTPR